MKNIFLSTFVVAFLFVGTAFTAHKFYVAIYQLNYNEDKRSIEITSRIFIDDVNNALSKKYGRVTHIGDKTESVEDVSLLKKYFSERFVVKINGQQVELTFLSKEMESNVLICYFKISEIHHIKTLEVTNKMLFDYVTEQQNIIQTKIYGKKNSLLLTVDDPSGSVSF